MGGAVAAVAASVAIMLCRRQKNAKITHAVNSPFISALAQNPPVSTKWERDRSQSNNASSTTTASAAVPEPAPGSEAPEGAQNNVAETPSSVRLQSEPPPQYEARARN